MDSLSHFGHAKPVRNKRGLVALLCVSLLGSWPAFAGEVDSRFDGMWTGTETVKTRVSAYPRYLEQFVSTVLLISGGGTLVAIGKGFVPGRYEVVSEKSGGDKLEFRMPNTNGDKLTFLGRQHCILKLSRDGNTITENGIAIVEIYKTVHGTSEVWGTFHRQ